MDDLRPRFDALESQMHVLQQHTHALARQLRWWRGLAAGLLVLVGLSWALPVGTAQQVEHEQTLEERVAALERLLKHFSRKGDDVTLTGANLHLVNGLGSTDCFNEQGEIPDCPNGLGNLIVGYNELRNLFDSPDIRTGSHNVVVGQEHNFSRLGGLVVGIFNEINGDFAVVSGGHSNTASGFVSVVSGGLSNTASGDNAVVSGGGLNTASGYAATVSGGGQFNTASGFGSVVSGGRHNTASGENAVVSGGQNRTAEGEFDWVAGDLFQDD